jgi:hypothetical protein
MCDLTPQEQEFIAASVSEINALAAEITEQNASIAETAFMDHEALAALLFTLRDRAAAAADWVAAKPHQHAH